MGPVMPGATGHPKQKYPELKEGYLVPFQPV
jgi:hypothetical protein